MRGLVPLLVRALGHTHARREGADRVLDLDAQLVRDLAAVVRDEEVEGLLVALALLHELRLVLDVLEVPSPVTRVH